jgi:tryptophan synthase alpha chain
MSRLSERMKALRARGERALIPFLTAGDPDLETTEALVLAMAEAGADVIEIGMPFSDPFGEGPTIQRSSERALAGGVDFRKCLELIARVRPAVDVPLLVMGYANPMLSLGEQGFAEAASAAGVDAVIVQDLPPEEGASFFEHCRARGIDPVLLAAPTTTPERLAMLARETRGFLYYVSLTGVTGARKSLASDIERNVRAAQALGDTPVCVGFGVSTPAHAAEIARYADGVVVGSAVVERIESASSRDEAVLSVTKFLREMKQAMSS